MADDQVKYSELVYDDNNAFEALLKALDSIKTKLTGLNQEAETLKGTLKGVSTATREQQQATADTAAAAENLRRKTKEVKDEQDELTKTLAKFANLTEEEAKQVAFLSQSLNFLNQNGTKNMNVWKNMTQSLDGFNMSYNQMSATVKVLEQSLKSLSDTQQRNSEGAKSAADAVKRLKDEMAKYDAQMKTQTVKTASEYKKLTEQEIASLNAFKAALKGTEQEQLEAVRNIDIQSKSYNELYQTYNALKDVLNGMTVAERENTEAGKAMVMQAKDIRDTLNNLQQQTGNYTLNVGNYMSAMSGLQMQTQQLLREIPSAQNLSQFFLAISNNIPMFTDALARYNKGLPEIKAKLAAVTAEIARQEAILAGLNTQSTEYAAKQAQINELKRQENQLQSASVSGWKAVLKSVGSWQTLLIAGLLLLRKIPDIIKWIKERWDRWMNGVKAVRNEVDGLTASIRLQADAIKKYASTAAQLDLIIGKMSEINQESDQWATGVRMINDLIGESKAKATDNLDTLREITEEYKKQAKQIAINNVLGEMYEQNIRNEMLREQGYNIYGKYASQGKGVDEMADAAAQMLGIALDSKEYKELKQLYQDQANAIYEYNRAIKGNYDEIRKTQLRSVRNAAGQMNMNLVEESDTEISKRVVKAKRDAEQAITNFFNKRLEIYSEEELNKLAQQEFELVDPLKGGRTPKEPKGPKDKVADLLSLQRQLEDAVIANIEDEFEREEAAENARHLRFIEDKQKELELVKGDAERTAVINQQIEEEQNTHDNNMLNIDEKYRQVIIKRIEDQKKKEEQAQKEAERAAKEKIQREEKDFKANQEIEKRKFELTKHTATEEKKFVMEQQMELLQWRIDHAAALGISPELLEVMKAEYEQMKKMYDLGKYSNGKQNIQGNYTSISQILWPDLDSDQTSALNSVFDQAKEALNGWMDAKKKAAEQAKELADDEVSAAENALNREIELRNQGYANDVALKERELADAKERQKKAAELQKKAEKDALAVNTAMEASSMAVAIANLFKDFPLYAAIPLTAVLLGSFAAAKVQSFQAINSTKYREGGYMLLEGGSHQSGHDVNLGIGPDGSNLRAEGGEYFAVINKRNSRKYSGEIPGIVNALNSGMFEDRYIKTSDAVGLLPRVVATDNGHNVDLSAVESGVGELVKQGERTWSTEGEYRVMRYKNLTRRVRISG